MRRVVFLLIALLTIMLGSCVKMDDKDNGSENRNEQNEFEENLKDSSVVFKKNVIRYGAEMNNYFQIINENTLHLSSGTPSNKIPKVGDLIFYNSNIASTGIFVGKVKSVNGNTKSGVNATVVETEIPSFEEIFSKLSLEVQMDSSNTIAIFDDEGSDEIVSCTVVGNSVWNSIETVYYDKNSGDTLIDSNLHNTKANPVPVDITLKIGVNSKYFEGNVYFNIKGRIYFEHLNGISNFAMELNKRIGLEGSLGFKIEGGKKIELDILPKILAKGITLYNNKMVGVRIVPHINLFADGAIKVETTLNYEFVNSDVKSIYNNGNFTGSHVEQLHDNYFRLHSLHTEGSFGLACTGNLYIFLFSDNFFQGGFKLSAGLAIQGENNQGIQFPGLANFDFEVVATPFVECSPFLAFREKKGLKKIEGQPLVSANLAPFPILLLPNIHEMNYEKRNNNKKLAVKGNIVGQNTSLICSRQEGVALFEKGEDNPVQVSPVQKGTKAPTGEMLFNISNDKSYEISPYVVTVDNVVVFGKRMPIDNDEIDDDDDDDDEIRSVLETLYYQTNGDNWTNNDNWCTDKPVKEWYGVSYHASTDSYRIKLRNNNLIGSLDIDWGLCDIEYLVLSDNNIPFVNFYSSKLKRFSCVNSGLIEFNISGCESLEDFDIIDNPLLTKVVASNLPSLQRFQYDHDEVTYVDMSGCTSITSFSHVGWTDYTNPDEPIIHRTPLRYLDLSNCISLEDLSVWNNSLFDLKINGCSSLTWVNCCDNFLGKIDLEGCDYLQQFHSVGNNIAVYDFRGKFNLIHAYPCESVEELYYSGCEEFVRIRDGVLDFYNLKKLKILELSNLGDLKTVQVDSCTSLTDMRLNGCTNLKNLRLLGCKSFDSKSLDHLPILELSNLDTLYVKGTTISKEITPFFDKLGVFHYDQRYRYITRDSVVDNGHGWWYPGEPERGYHKR